MTHKPILLLTHSRSCSTAFERIFMTCPSTVQCIHEPFGDPFYFGPEKISPAFADNPERCLASGHSQSTYASIVSSISDTMTIHPDRRLFIKDMSYHIIPCYPHLTPSTAAPSLSSQRTEPEDANNPSLLPWSFLRQFQITFLIRDPERSVPSKYKFTVPPISHTSNMKAFYDREVGYRELRLMFDFLQECQTAGDGGGAGDIVLLDAEDLLAHPVAVVREYCERVSLEFDENMMKWDSKEEHAVARSLLEKYKAYHVEAMESKGFGSQAESALVTQGKNKAMNPDDQWRARYGEDGAKLLRSVVDGARNDYEYLRQFRLRYN